MPGIVYQAGDRTSAAFRLEDNIERYQMKVLKKAISAGVLTMVFEKIGKKVVIDLSEFPEANHLEAEEHGYLQRFGDLESGDPKGDLKYAAVLELAEHYKDGGDWRMTAGPRDTTGIVVEAMVRLHPKKYTVAALQKAIAIKPEQVKTWRSDLKVKAEIQRIYAERTAAAAADDDEEIVVEGLDDEEAE